jgi:Na+/melibiose symporter-like transporter
MDRIKSSWSKYVFIRYSLLAMPISFLGIPLYIHLPKYYHDNYSVSLSILGIILFCCRLLDALIDPFLGVISDRYNLTRKRYFIFFAIFITLIFNSFFLLPANKTALFNIIWFSICSLGVYFFYSLLYINYYNLGLKLAENHAENLKLSSIREFSSFIGILAASSIPGILSQFVQNDSVIFLIYGLIFALCILFSVYFIPEKGNNNFSEQPPNIKIDNKLKIILENPYRKISKIFVDRDLRNLLILFFINTIPVSITSNLFGFYTQEVINAENYNSLFLLSYFLSASFSAVLTSFFAKKFSKISLLMYAMIISVISFSFTAFTNRDNFMFFLPICIMSGVGLGAELSILPSLAADLLNSKKEYGSIFFGIWGSLSKISLGLAAGIFLPLISYSKNIFLNIAPETKILFIYSIIPLMIKIGVIFYYKMIILKNRRCYD